MYTPCVCVCVYVYACVMQRCQKKIFGILAQGGAAQQQQFLNKLLSVFVCVCVRVCVCGAWLGSPLALFMPHFALPFECSALLLLLPACSLSLPPSPSLCLSLSRALSPCLPSSPLSISHSYSLAWHSCA